jgi:REP element-mobilizing transposase RayT
MPRPRKLHVHDTVLFATASLEEGVFLLANPLVKALLRSAMARAQTLFPVTICHFLVEGTHIHFILVVDNPDDVKGFMERFKTESAHYINHLLGRKKRTVWCEGYDSPVLITPEDVVSRIVYIYTNPAKDNLEDSVAKYPGLSSWEMFTKGRYEQEWAWIHRDRVPKIADKLLLPKDINALAGELLANAEKQDFCIEPNAWMECFGIVEPETQAELNEEILRRISEKEEEYRKERMDSGKTVMGREYLLREGFNLTYRPERSGRRMWCICCDRAKRKAFILRVKELCKVAREVYQRWKVGDYSLPFPLGLYPPARPKVVEPISFWA